MDEVNSNQHFHEIKTEGKKEKKLTRKYSKNFIKFSTALC